MYALERVGGGFGDQLARAGGACEGHHVDIRVRRKLASNADAIAVHEIEHAFRETGGVHHFGKKHRVERAFLGGFQHHRASRDGCCADLERDLVHGPVPRRDQRTHTDRFVDDTVVWCVVSEWAIKCKILGILDEILDMPCARANLTGARHVNRRTHLKAHRLGHFLATGFVDVEQLFDIGQTLFRGGCHPGRERRLGRRNGCIGVGLTTERNDGAWLFR